MRRAQLKRTASRRKAKIPIHVRREVKARQGGRCAACMARRESWAPRIAHLHHVFSEQRFPELAVEPDNLVGLCLSCHLSHEYPGVNARRIPRSAIVRALRFATTGARQAYIERTYPT